MINVPTSTHVLESTVISAPLSKVWHLIKLNTFDQFWNALEKSEVAEDANEEAEIFTWTFKDSTVLTIKQEAHSSLNHSISFSIIGAKPALNYYSSLSTIRCYHITSGKEAGGTYIEWSGDFSGDADAEVIEDARFKRKEALADLTRKVTPPTTKA